MTIRPAGFAFVTSSTQFRSSEDSGTWTETPEFTSFSDSFQQPEKEYKRFGIRVLSSSGSQGAPVVLDITSMTDCASRAAAARLQHTADGANWTSEAPAGETGDPVRDHYAARRGTLVP